MKGVFMNSVNDSDIFPADFAKKARPAREVLEQDFGKENAEKILKGRVGRAVAESPKTQVTIRMDANILAEFRSHGKGWQTEINNILRQWVENRPH